MRTERMEVSEVPNRRGKRISEMESPNVSKRIRTELKETRPQHSEIPYDTAEIRNILPDRLLDVPEKEGTALPSSEKVDVARVFRGRGNVGPVHLDKLFTEGYNPRLDIENYDESNLHHYVDALEDLSTKTMKSSKKKKSKEAKKEKKDKKKKKKKKHSVDDRDLEESCTKEAFNAPKSPSLEDKRTYGPAYNGPRTDINSACPW
ncbi:hypothetical protein HDU67_001266 [Dinochytrium kinnereticum]|nr:hypothetical protein HDU67_001266 [Dinochytrium kinnereticum]